MSFKPLFLSKKFLCNTERERESHLEKMEVSKQQQKYFFVLLVLFSLLFFVKSSKEAKQSQEIQLDQKHFVLVHGLGHGAWCWYKLKPLLESAGHRVTALDLAASGVDTKTIYELRTFYEYNEPLLGLMASIPRGEKVILVGHSLGGMNLAFAMDKYPKKILVAVFLTAQMPDTVHKPSYVAEQILARTSLESWVDTKFVPYGTPEEPQTSVILGPKFLASYLYQQSPIQDFVLASTLIRPGSVFVEDFAKAKKLSNEGYGSVKRVYVVCKDDKTVTEDLQRWMIENSGVQEVKEIKGADHMAMLSKPKQLCYRLLEIANKYA